MFDLAGPVWFSARAWVRVRIRVAVRVQVTAWVVTVWLVICLSRIQTVCSIIRGVYVGYMIGI